jgi:hypothetical protein
MDLPASYRSAHKADPAPCGLLTPCGLTLLNLTAAGVLSTHPALAQCATTNACGPSAAYTPLNRSDLPGQTVVVSTTAVSIELPTHSFGDAHHTSSAPAPRSAPATESALQPDFRNITGDLGATAASSSASAGASLLRLQSTILNQDVTGSSNENGGPTNLWNAESILWKADRTGGPCSLNRQGPQINTCR